MTLPAVALTTSCFLILSSSEPAAVLICMPFLPWLHRARRNAKGHLEPDASDSAVQKSMGFENYEMAPRKEDRREGDEAGSS